ncbi:hypothetical protein DACRYDRAFT_103255 [Dacryopinax primogenitus]|uniref:Uncharacterized protein n=1 Tax=Dacryopinax primogenitus (strain DJM 731) TaxID=1858805 RepID=M5GFH8_DACPD|nr:uncharacterized protein DACRYDRAFT_103255 [Dacryopinax primogenitus]EJU06307.1 hypothetical protein DACRYDRAFT_103255 [Dacryopinax primogenitus]
MQSTTWRLTFDQRQHRQRTFPPLAWVYACDLERPRTTTPRTPRTPPRLVTPRLPDLQHLYLPSVSLSLSPLQLTPPTHTPNPPSRSGNPVQTRVAVSDPAAWLGTPRAGALRSPVLLPPPLCLENREDQQRGRSHDARGDRSPNPMHRTALTQTPQPNLQRQRISQPYRMEQDLPVSPVARGQPKVSSPLHLQLSAPFSPLAVFPPRPTQITRPSASPTTGKTYPPISPSSPNPTGLVPPAQLSHHPPMPRLTPAQIRNLLDFLERADLEIERGCARVSEDLGEVRRELARVRQMKRS